MITNGKPQTGHAEKQQVLKRLATRHAAYVRQGRRALLLAVLERGAATADDVRAATELPEHIDPRCLGAVPGPLVRAGLIELLGYERSSRPERHASVIATWGLLDRQKALEYLAGHPDTPDTMDYDPEPEQLNLFV